MSSDGRQPHLLGYMALGHHCGSEKHIIWSVCCTEGETLESPESQPRPSISDPEQNDPDLLAREENARNY